MTRYVATVLVIEDDPEVLGIARDVLARHGYCAVPASDGRTALAVLAAIKVAVILLDLVMPAMNGWEFLAARRTHPALAAIPVVVVSGFGAVDGLDGPGDWAEVVQKPFSTAQLVEVVSRQCALTTPLPARG